MSSIVEATGLGVISLPSLCCCFLRGDEIFKHFDGGCCHAWWVLRVGVGREMSNLKGIRLGKRLKSAVQNIILIKSKVRLKGMFSEVESGGTLIGKLNGRPKFGYFTNNMSTKYEIYLKDDGLIDVKSVQ